MKFRLPEVLVLLLALGGMYWLGYHDGFTRALSDVQHCRVVIGASVHRVCRP